MIRYACISGDVRPVKDRVKPWISAYELPALYRVPEDECTFIMDSYALKHISPYGVPEDECICVIRSHILRNSIKFTFNIKSISPNLIPLTPRPDGDYKTHLKVLKAHHLIENK